ncbi:MAG: PspC domain-containing protein [Lactobacillaceae bacterium]|jgi:phage shock protein PspC (stress-responsive transcriptional regulator)|nr:PspC domain-containing protein [Lactobacillaceae bacterium]
MRRLYRRTRDSVFGGVAGGVADYFGWNIGMVRTIWLILALFSVSGFFWIYIIMWIVLPVGTAKEFDQADEVRELKGQLVSRNSDRTDEIEALKSELDNVEQADAQAQQKAASSNKPDANSTVAEIKNYLDEHDIEYSSRATKADLLNLVK